MNLLLIPSGLGMSTLLVREVAANQARQEWSYFHGILLRSHQIIFVASIIMVGLAMLVLWLLSDKIVVNQIQTIFFMIVLFL